MPFRIPSCRSSLAVPTLLALSSLGLAAASDSWDFNPPDDQFSDAALIDLRAMNEKVAGESGFVKRTADGEHFVLGDGKPVRFWCMNVGGGAANADDLAHEARFLAKHGVNMIRLHTQLSPPNEGSNVTDVNMDTVHQIWKTVAAMKKEGIYSIISPYWAGATQGLKNSWGITGHSDPWGVLFTDDVLQSGYMAWLKALYNDPDPENGKTLSEEPAVAIIQLQNEDSLLFWTMIGFINGGGQPFDQLRKGFGDFAVKKYGSIAAARSAWTNTDAPGDDIGNGMLGFFQVWEITSNPGGPKGERVADQIEYWTTVMKDFNVGVEKYLHSELHCKQLVNAGNWRVADIVKQFDSERYSYTGNEVIAVNRYMSGIHNGPNNGWALDPGATYTNVSCTLDPTQLPINAKQVVGYPFMVTESAWVMPNLYQSEGPLFISAYSSLSGVDCFFWFASSARNWDPALEPWNKAPKWSVSTPMGVGLFPAAAIEFRNNYIEPGAVVVHEERDLADMWHEKNPIIAEEAGYDPNRDAGLPAKSSVKTTVNPLAFLAGRVEVVYGGNSQKSKVVDLKPLIDEVAKTVTSTTKQEKLDYGNGLLTVDSPKAQSVAGFLSKAGTIKLTDVAITCSNTYASIMVVAMDNLPLKESKKILVQIGTTQRATNWQEHASQVESDPKTHATVDGFTIDSPGTNPFTVEVATGTVSINNAGLTKATLVDPNGMAAGDGGGTASNGVFTLPLPSSSLYVVLTAGPAAR